MEAFCTMVKKIKFASSDETITTPKPSLRYIPDWYKKSEKFIGGKPQVVNYSKNLGLKACIPFIDAMKTGYIVETWQDIQVVQTSSGPSVSWVTHPDPISYRGNSPDELMPVPAGCSPNSFVWLTNISMETPKGYSVLVTHPFNRSDLPFVTLSGVVDTDGGMYGGNLPFFFKENFEGIIPIGTPMFQIFPFKRENWELEIDAELHNKTTSLRKNSLKHISGWYHKTLWNRKTYL